MGVTGSFGYRTRRLAGLLVLLAVGGARVGCAQWYSPAIPRAGFHVSSVSAYVGPSISRLSGATEAAFVGFPIGTDMETGGAITVGWTPGQKFSAVYSASGSAALHHPEWNFLNHSLSLGASGRLRGRWRIGFSGAGSATGLSQFVFTPLDNAAAPPVGQPGNPASDPRPAPPAATPTAGEAPLRTLVYGNRVLTASIGSTLSYAYSRRLSIDFTAGMDHNQPLIDAQNSNYLQLHSTGASAGAGISYKAAPHTQTGLHVSFSRRISGIEDTYAAAVTGSVSRNIGRYWLAQGRTGVSAIKVLRQTYGLSGRPGYLVGGAFGFRTSTHNLLVSTDRSITNSYGLGAQLNSTTTGSWSWSHPGAKWSLSASGSRQTLGSARFGGLRGWQVNGGVNRPLSRNVSSRLEYAYLFNSGILADRTYDLSIHTVRLSLVWNPPTEGFRSEAPASRP